MALTAGLGVACVMLGLVAVLGDGDADWVAPVILALSGGVAAATSATSGSGGCCIRRKRAAKHAAGHEGADAASEGRDDDLSNWPAAWGASRRDLAKRWVSRLRLGSSEPPRSGL